MKTVFFIRHAKSSWKEPQQRDFDRPLNKRGKRDAPLMAGKFAARKLPIDALISSPAKRALLTAASFARALELPESAILHEARLYDAYPDTILSLVRALPENYRTVLVFGHNPAFTMLANQFADHPIDNIPTCGIFRIVPQHIVSPQFILLSLDKLLAKQRLLVSQIFV